MNEKAFLAEYQQHINQQLFQVGKVMASIILVVLFYFIYSDINFRNIPVWVYTRILPITFLGLFLIMVHTNLAKTRPYIVKTTYYLALFFLVCMSLAMFGLAWKTDLIQTSITALMVVSLGVFLGMRGSIRLLLVLYFVPVILFILYSILFFDDLSNLANLPNAIASMMGLTAIYAYEEKLRKQIFLSHKELDLQARTDLLTKLNNRRSIWEFINLETHRFERTGQPFSLILLDIDHFKKVNDQYGHDAGDIALVQVGEILMKTVRKMDIAARWGGEEFLILLPNTNVKQASAMAERLRQSIEITPIRLENDSFHITATIGLGQYNEKETIDQVLKHIDKALYQGKKGGRNQLVLAAESRVG